MKKKILIFTLCIVFLFVIFLVAQKPLVKPIFIKLSDLFDVSKTNATDGQFFKYIASTKLWTPSTIPGGGSAVGRTATFTVAANNSSTLAKAQADYTCDGTADNVEIQAAIDALPAIGSHKSGKIFLFEGSFNIAAVITVNSTFEEVTIQGSGKATTVLVLTTDTDIFNFTGATGVRVIQMGFHNEMPIYPERSGTEHEGHAIKVDGGGRIDILDCFFWNFVGSAVRFENSIVAPKIWGCYIAFCGDPTLSYAAVEYKAGVGHISDEVTVFSTEIGGSFYRSILADTNVNNLTISACYFEGNKHGGANYEPAVTIQAAGNYVKVSDNTFVNAGTDIAVRATGSRCTIRGNTIWDGEGSGFSIAGEGIISENICSSLEGSACHCNGSAGHITNNVIINCGITDNQPAIYGGGNRNIISNNRIHNAKKYIWIEFGSKCLVTDNYLTKGGETVTYAIKGAAAGNEGHFVHGNILNGFAAADWQVPTTGNTYIRYGEVSNDIIISPSGGDTIIVGNLEMDKLETKECFTYDAAQSTTGDGTTTIDWGLGNFFYFTFGAQNDAFTFTAPPGVAECTLFIKQDGTGNRTINWAGVTILWPGDVEPTLSTAANAVDIIGLAWDGTSWHGLFNGDFR